MTFPIPAAGYQKFKNPASRYAMAGVFVARLKDGAIRVGVTGAHGDGVFRANDIEAALTSSYGGGGRGGDDRPRGCSPTSTVPPPTAPTSSR